MTDDAPTNGPGADPAPGDGPTDPTGPVAPPTAGDILREAEGGRDGGSDGTMAPPHAFDDGDALPEAPVPDDTAAPATPPPPAPGLHPVKVVAIGPERSGLTAALAPIGAGLLGAAVAISAARSRSDDELDVSTFAVGVGASALLLVLALLAAVGVRRLAGGRPRADAVTWPGVVGILGTAVMVSVGVDSDERWFAYLEGGLVAGLAIVGYLIARRAAFVVTAVAGLALLYGLAFEDLVADSVDGASGVVVLAGAIGAFVVLVTLLGWALPTRVVSGVSVGAVGVVAYGGILAGLVVLRAVGDLFGDLGGGLFSEFANLGGAAETPQPLPDGLGGLDGFGSVDKFDPATGFDPSLVPSPGATPDPSTLPDPSALATGTPGSDGGSDPFSLLSGLGFSTSDVWWVLGFAAVLTSLWAVAAWLSNHTGFAVLATAMPVVTVPLAAAALAVEHPTYWAAAVAAAGAVLVLGATLLAKRRAQRVDPWGEPPGDPVPWPPPAPTAPEATADVPSVDEPGVDEPARG